MGLVRLWIVLAVWTLAAVPAAGQEAQAPAPGQASRPGGVADLVPRAARLEERLSALETRVQGDTDLEALRKDLERVNTAVGELGRRLSALRASGRYSYDDLAEIKAALRARADEVARLSAPVSKRLAELDREQAWWLGERKQWKEWARELPPDVPRATLKPILDQANRAIDRALGRISSAVKPLVALQQEAAAVGTAAQGLIAETDGLAEKLRGEMLSRSAPSVLSARFYTEIRDALWPGLRMGVARARLPGRAFLESRGWVLLVQLALSGLLAGALRRRRATVAAHPRWGFVAQRPLAAALLVGFGVPSVLYGAAPLSWRLLQWGVVSVAGARLSAPLLREPWKRRWVYALAFLFVASLALRVAGLPEPLFRVYVLAVGLGGAPLCLVRARRLRRLASPGPEIWALRAGGALLAAVAVAQAAGYANLATHLLESSIKTAFLFLLAWMAALLTRGAVELLTHSKAWRRLPLAPSRADALAGHLSAAAEAVVALIGVGIVLEVWRVYDTPWEAIEAILSWGVAIGGVRVSVGLCLGAGLLLYASVVISWGLQGVLERQVYPRRGVDTGTGISINRLVHYGLVLVGFMLALSTLGVELRNVTILAGAFGIGIGFGLQNIVNNFVSGLILLFERPVKVGDVIQVGDQRAVVRKLGLRATVVQTFDRSEVIVPNSELVSSRVINWTLSDRTVRVVVPVGVAYGSDVPRVMGILEEVARGHPSVRTDPEPQVLFVGFGDSSLDFEVRVWINNLDERLQVMSDLHREIERRFTEAGVEIPFPQRDLHLRTVDPAAGRHLRGPGPHEG